MLCLSDLSRAQPRHIEKVDKFPLESQNWNTWRHKANKGKYMMFSVKGLHCHVYLGKERRRLLLACRGRKAAVREAWVEQRAGTSVSESMREEAWEGAVLLRGSGGTTCTGAGCCSGGTLGRWVRHGCRLWRTGLLLSHPAQLIAVPLQARTEQIQLVPLKEAGFARTEVCTSFTRLFFPNVSIKALLLRWRDLRR